MTLYGAPWWEAATALGTVGAVAVALLLAWSESRRARRAEEALTDERASQLERLEEAPSSMVSAWVEIEPTPSSQGTYYERRATVHVANESDRPVYNANVCIGVQNEPGRWTPVGPLAVPLPLPVLASRSRQSWDITLPLLACSIEAGNFMSGPTAAIAFTDPSGDRWTRNFDLALTRQSQEGEAALFAIDPEHSEEQMGQIENFFNPVTAVLLFLNALRREEGPDWQLARTLLDPAAKGWSEMTEEQWAEAAERWSQLGIAAHVHYPAPRIAYVKTLTDEAADQRIEGPGYVEVPMTLFTLRFVRGSGWMVFSVGVPTPADKIEFPEKDLHLDPRGATPAKSRLARADCYASFFISALFGGASVAVGREGEEVGHDRTFETEDVDRSPE